MTDNIIESVKSDRPWKRIYRERTEQIAAFLGADAKTIAEHQLPEKFAKLMTADTTADKAASYRELAISDLNSMAEAIGKLVTQIVEAGDLKAVCADTENEEDHAMVKTFSAFSEDLKDDLQNIQAAILESVKSTSSVSDLGKLYDTLALESCTYEMASRFVSTMSSKLRASK